MVVGSGLIGKRFKAYSDSTAHLIFASGVSNSSAADTIAFEREAELLAATSVVHPKKILVYFSTCSIYDVALAQSPYVRHKVAMEKLVAMHAGGYIIFRVSNPVGHTPNNNTVFNFFIQHIQSGLPFTVWAEAQRNLIDLDDMYSACDFILQQQLFLNRIINVANPVNYRVLDIVQVIEKYLHRRAIYTLVDKASAPLIDVTDILPVYKSLSISFGENYLWQTLEKYFPQDELS